MGRNSNHAARWARLLGAGCAIDAKLAVVVAHADDETLWAGSALPRMSDCRLIHATDGAPRDMADAARLGFATRDAYAGARAVELDGALVLLGARVERVAYGIVDQETALAMADLVDRLEADLADRTVAITHPYEGGHPDHDTLALSVRLAADRLARRSGRAPAVVEFACYQQAGGERRFGEFFPDPAAPEQVRTLSVDERARVAAAIEAHATQAAVVGGWRPAVERWRAAPDYRFVEPPPPGAALYDGFGWAMTSARWRALAGEAIARERS